MLLRHFRKLESVECARTVRLMHNEPFNDECVRAGSLARERCKPSEATPSIEGYTERHSGEPLGFWCHTR